MSVLITLTVLKKQGENNDGREIDIILFWFQGPKGENIGAITQPLPYSYLIFRAPYEAAGKTFQSIYPQNRQNVKFGSECDATCHSL